MFRSRPASRTLNSAAFAMVFAALLLASGPLRLFSADAPPASPANDDQLLQQRIAAYTQKMRDANYPPLFEKAAQEFNVPPDVLKGIAFAETRWSQLTWPPGETVSPETGMPRPYGIMSLWDNEYFGHGLLDAAKLIGQDPEVLKTDPFQNMRGAAALLRKLYESTPSPPMPPATNSKAGARPSPVIPAFRRLNCASNTPSRFMSSSTRVTTNTASSGTAIR